MLRLIYIKELKSLLRSPMAFIIVGLFTLVMGWMFYNQLTYFTENIQKLPVSMRNEYDFANEVIVKLFGSINFVLIFITPILSMKMFSEEIKDRIIDIYYSSPISMLELILGKYFALITWGGVIIASTLIFPLFLGRQNIHDVGFILSGYLGVLLNFSCFAAMGLLASSLTKSQVLSAVFGFVIILFSWLTGMFSHITDNYLLSEILRYLSINAHFEHFARGHISLSDICFYLSFITFFIVLLKNVLQSRQW